MSRILTNAEDKWAFNAVLNGKPDDIAVLQDRLRELGASEEFVAFVTAAAAGSDE